MTYDYRHINRRRMLQLTGAGTLGGMLMGAPGLSGTLLAAGRPALRSLGDRAFVIETDYAGVLGLHNEAGVLLVGGVAAEDSEALLTVLDEHTGGAPVKTVYNTHWHWDQTGSNEALAERGARIIAHENTRLWLTNDFYVDWQDRHYKPRPPEALPTETFYEQHELEFGDERVNSELLFQAHTDGDIYVHLRGLNILAVGDLATQGTFPLVDPVTGGWIGGLTAAQEKLLALADEQTVIIPGSGGVMDRAGLQRQYDMLVTMRERIYEFARQGKGPREMLNEGVADGFEEWGDPTRFVLNAYPGLGRHYRQVDGVV